MTTTKSATTTTPKGATAAARETAGARQSSLEMDIEGPLEVWSERRDTWVYVAVPQGGHDAVTEVFKADPRGFRSVPVIARIRDQEWRTAFFRYRDGRWALPIKADVRRRHHLEPGGTVRVHVAVLP